MACVICKFWHAVFGSLASQCLVSGIVSSRKNVNFAFLIYLKRDDGPVQFIRQGHVQFLSFVVSEATRYSLEIKLQTVASVLAAY